MLYQFSNPDNLLWFPSNGVKNPATYNNDWSSFSLDSIKHQAPYFVLPIIAFTYSSFAFTSRIMRVSMIDVLGADYIRTARAKGLSERKVVLKHGLRNGLLPIITMFSNVGDTSSNRYVLFQKFRIGAFLFKFGNKFLHLVLDVEFMRVNRVILLIFLGKNVFRTIFIIFTRIN